MRQPEGLLEELEHAPAQVGKLLHVAARRNLGASDE
jgi:hypothetical protein